MLTLIARHSRYSPNSEARDEVLFRSLVMNFALQGVSVATFDEAVFENHPPQLEKSTLILSMARSEAALHALSAAEERGVIVLNSPRALQKAQRTDFQQWFAKSGHAAKHWHTSELTPELKATLPFPLWWKRNNPSTTSANDVQFVEHHAQLDAILSKHANEDALVMEHIEGQLVKFYGVVGTNFFHAEPHSPKGFSKFGNEQHNHHKDLAVSAPMWKQTLRAMHTAATQVAQQSGFSIYGGDAILREDGTFVFIDFNDFPSFSACLPEASEAIVQHCLSLLAK
jgi:hypothetical protein